MKVSAAETLETELADIEVFERAAAIERWREVFERPPPKHISPRFMTCILNWETQIRLIGGCNAKTERAIKQIASGKPLPTAAKPGSHLVREWNGRTYQVEVTRDGYVMDGRSYRSLSAIARRITGARWSRPTLLWVNLMRRVRCVIYTRKSTEDGLEQDFNSLDAQREACEAYIASQKHEGWELLPTHYDDGGISGGHLERPALQR